MQPGTSLVEANRIGAVAETLIRQVPEVTQLGQLNGLTTAEGVTQGLPKIVSDIDACEVILQLAPETNGHVAVKAWASLGEFTG